MRGFISPTRRKSQAKYAAITLTLAALLGAAGTVPAQTPGPTRPLTLLEGFDAAWALSPEARASALWRDAAQATQEAAARWTAAPVTLDVTARTDRSGRNEGRREYEAAVAVPLWLAGERAGTQALAQAQSQAQDARWQAARWRVAAQVRDAWWTWQLASVGRDLARQRLASARELAEDVRRRWQAGDMARADNHQGEAALMDAQAQLAQAEAEYAQAWHDWLALTGNVSSPHTPAAASEAASALENAPETPQERLSGEPEVADIANALHAVEQYLERHPAVREAAVQVEMAQRQLALAAVQVRSNPELVMGSTRERDLRGARYAPSIFAGVRMALGRLPESKAQQLKARAELLEAQSRLAQEESAVRARITAAWQQWQALRQAHAAARQRARLAVEVRGFFERSFQLGETDLPTRLRMAQEATQAEREAARTQVQALASLSQLRQALGRLPE